MLETKLERRWQEIIFFHVCNKMVLFKRKDYNALFRLIDGLAEFGSYDPQIVKQCAYKIVADANKRPTRREIMHLGEQLNVPPNFMFLLVDRRYVQRKIWVRQDKEKGVEYFALPRFTKAEYNEITRFTGTLIYFSEQLFLGEYKLKKALGPLEFIRREPIITDDRATD